MADKGIIFSAPMARALLNGRKTQTRRILKPAPPSWIYERDKPGHSCLTPKGHIEFRGRYVDPEGVDHGPASKFIKLPYFKGERLYVREACAVDGQVVWYRLDHEEALARGPRVDVRWRPSIHMPRAASRMWLCVTDVRVQRLQECSEADAKAEGIEGFACIGGQAWRDYSGGSGFNMTDPVTPAKRSYSTLWDTLHTAEGERWQDNPWVVAVTFEVHHGNIDEVLP